MSELDITLSETREGTRSLIVKEQMPNMLYFFVGIGLAFMCFVFAAYITIQINSIIPRKLRELENGIDDQERRNERYRLERLKEKLEKGHSVQILMEAAPLLATAAIVILVISLH